MLAMLCWPFDFLAHKLLNHLAFSVPDEDYSRKVQLDIYVL